MRLIILIHFHFHKTTMEYNILCSYWQIGQKGDGSIELGWRPIIAFPNNVICVREEGLVIQAIDRDDEAGNCVLLLFFRCFSEYPCVLYSMC